MELKKAVDLTGRALSKMLLGSSRPAFNEWMIIELKEGRCELKHYCGPRSDSSHHKINSDLRGLEDEMKQDGYVPGQFFFIPDGKGTLYDAFMVAGDKRYILFNNTLMTMAEIAADPFWNKIQIHFVELSEQFYADRLE